MPRDADDAAKRPHEGHPSRGSGANRADAFSVSIALAHHLRRGGRQRREAGATAQACYPSAVKLGNPSSTVLAESGVCDLGPGVLGRVDHGIKQILAVYHTCPVMIVAETAEDTIVELSLNELAEVYECLPPPLWQH